jgi:hypothetical protein
MIWLLLKGFCHELALERTPGSGLSPHLKLPLLLSGQGEQVQGEERERERERGISHGCLEECSCLNMVTKIVGYEPQFNFL